MRVCKYCGCVLDAGEPCDCQLKKATDEKAETIEETKPLIIMHRSFSEKVAALENFFNDAIGELRGEISFGSIYKEHWNKLDFYECQSHIELIIFKINKELEVIKKMCVFFYDECRKKYMENFNLVDALQLEHLLREVKGIKL